MDDQFLQTPSGWTTQGMRPGWLRPVLTPDGARVRKLEQENRKLQGQMNELRTLVEGLMKRNEV